MNELSIKSETIGFVEVLKSKFTAFIFPTDNVETFKTRLEEIRKANPKAKHIVYAYRIGVNSKSTDDKEPKGTAGRPLLELLMKKNLNNTAIIVVRYYGGSQLGAGRLLRTYVSSAVSALDKAEFIEL
jgi:putative IMPACT (imprinted ancient) family translation regulator